MNYSFKELQNEYKIIIPRIQRDYAQGREDKHGDKKIKSHDFIIKLIDVLNTDKPALNLDFVYGYTKKIDEDKPAFIPLDGQQRLTTLWLLHWYLSPKKETEQNGIKMMSVTDDVKSWLKNFTYETRNSSKRFCEELIEEWLPISGDICHEINEASWFMASWKNDPTVVSLLNMLEVIQKQDFDRKKAWKNISENKKITFDYIDIKSEEFKLTDELYIKMNSRGKPLTDFENFKAQFSEILSADKELKYESTLISYQEYFAFKIDSVWTDLFWCFARDMEKEEGKDIDVYFMNFFTYIDQMCYFKDNRDKNVSDFKNDFLVFRKKDNALFLFNTLDFFHKTSMDESGQIKLENIGALFENIFRKGEIDGSPDGQVRLFEGEEINLFRKCLLEGDQFDNTSRILLFCILSYMLKYDLKEPSAELRYYSRVIRNLLTATRQKRDTDYEKAIRINSFGKYRKLFNQLMEKPNVYERLPEKIDNRETDISDEALNNEKEKAQIFMDNISSDRKKIRALFRLEDYEHFKGLIHNLNPKANIDSLTEWSDFIREIWKCEDPLIAASLITCDFGGFYTKWGGMGDMYFFGNSQYWYTILSGQTDQELSEPITALLKKYGENKKSSPALKPQAILEKMIKEFIDSLKFKNWQYYFCKYKEYFLSGTNYFSWSNDEFEHEILGRTSSSPLLAYHINPYVKTVSNRLDDSICREGSCYIRYAEESCLVLENEFHLYSKQDGWHIEIPKKQRIPDELRKKYNINEQNVFCEARGKDRIEIAVDFCRDLASAVTG